MVLLKNSMLLLKQMCCNANELYKIDFHDIVMGKVYVGNVSAPN